MIHAHRKDQDAPKFGLKPVEAGDDSADDAYDGDRGGDDESNGIEEIEAGEVQELAEGGGKSKNKHKAWPSLEDSAAPAKKKEPKKRKGTCSLNRYSSLLKLLYISRNHDPEPWQGSQSKRHGIQATKEGLSGG